MSDDKKVIFSMSGVTKAYQTSQIPVLKNIYLSFFYGAKIGILGLNGSGKSTLLKIIAGVDINYRGDVVFADGYSVGYLEQEPQLDDSKTVIEAEHKASTDEEYKAIVEQYAEAELQLIQSRYHYNNLDTYVSLKQSELNRDLALNSKV